MGILDELKQNESKIKVTLNLDKKVIEKVDEIRKEFGIKSRSYAVNKLLWLIIRQIEREKRRKKKHNLVEEHKNKEQEKEQEQEHSPEEQYIEQQNKTQFIAELRPYSLDKIVRKQK
jgi:metal-responsive CopG/Arc/MetJ family transcriptional regulator